MAFRQAQDKLDEFLMAEKQGEVAVYFLDESGFDTVSPVPYAWQKRAERTGLPA